MSAGIHDRPADASRVRKRIVSVLRRGVRRGSLPSTQFIGTRSERGAVGRADPIGNEGSLPRRARRGSAQLVDHARIRRLDGGALSVANAVARGLALVREAVREKRSAV